MQHLLALLDTRFSHALGSAFGPELADTDPLLRGATRPEFGHLQTNLPLRLAKPLGLPPREVGARLLAALDVADLCLPPELAGAGFVNLTWRPDVLAAEVTRLLADDRLGVPAPTDPQRVVVDYSQPNVAKQMHVGHLRSTVIGDALARVLTLAGHDVVRQNHVGDWGTQFGMLVELHDELDAGAAADLDLAGLDALYRRARARFDSDPVFADAARRRVVALQSGDPGTLATWQRMIDVSTHAFEAAYDRLGVLLTPEDVAGESSYNAALPGVVADLDAAGLLEESDGALCVFPPGFTGRDGAPLPLIVRKSDGGFGYAATDLAAIRHRVGVLGADRIAYVVDARQALHFAQVFAVARLAGWIPEHVEVEHVAFGTVLGPDGKPFKTRSGETVSLHSLLDDAEDRALALLDERATIPAGPERDAAARAVGLGAVKWADLSSGRGRDYVFDLDRMVAVDGDTAHYLQYAHARLGSLLAKAAVVPTVVGELDHPAEQQLALLLARTPDVVATVVHTLEPHHLCGHLFAVAVALSRFYEACPVLRADPAQRDSRLALCRATRRVLGTGLGLLGIETPEPM